MANLVNILEMGYSCNDKHVLLTTQLDTAWRFQASRFSGKL